MGSIAVATRNAMLDGSCRTAADPNASIWGKLHTADPTTAGTAAPAAETDRQQAAFSAASGGTSASSTNLDWTNVASTETYTHVSLWTASAAGTFLGSDDLSATAAMTAGDTFRIPSTQLTVSLA